MAATVVESGGSFVGERSDDIADGLTAARYRLRYSACCANCSSGYVLRIRGDLGGLRVILYSNAFNSAGERVRIALALKVIRYEYVSIQDLGWDAYAALNPQALLPTLKVGDDCLTQSPAILEYLEERYPTPGLLPRDPFLRAHARAFGQAIASEMHAIDVLRTRQFLRSELKVSKHGIEQWTDHWFIKGVQALEGFLSSCKHHTRYCYSDEPGWAELFLVPQLRKSVGRYFLDISAYPLVAGVYQSCLDHPAFIAAAAEQQPDYERAHADITIRGQNDGPLM